jgi:hypothetical protein
MMYISIFFINYMNDEFNFILLYYHLYKNSKDTIENSGK